MKNTISIINHAKCTRYAKVLYIDQRDLDHNLPPLGKCRKHRVNYGKCGKTAQKSWKNLHQVDITLTLEHPYREVGHVYFDN